MALTNDVSSVITIIRGLIGDQLRKDGRDSYIFDSDKDFVLSEDFIKASTIRVFKNGDEVSSSDFSFDSDTNTLTISFVTSGESISKNDTILVIYHYFKEYSDTEIQGFLSSSLSYFVQHKYKKTFEITDDDKIVAINDLDPTAEEIYFIALIASILIDPKNLRISIPDLNISPARDKSDQQQILEAFRQFNKFIGRVDLESFHVDNHDGLH